MKCDQTVFCNYKGYKSEIKDAQIVSDESLNTDKEDVALWNLGSMEDKKRWEEQGMGRERGRKREGLELSELDDLKELE